MSDKAKHLLVCTISSAFASACALMGEMNEE